MKEGQAAFSETQLQLGSSGNEILFPKICRDFYFQLKDPPVVAFTNILLKAFETI